MAGELEMGMGVDKARRKTHVAVINDLICLWGDLAPSPHGEDHITADEDPSVGHRRHNNGMHPAGPVAYRPIHSRQSSPTVPRFL